MSDYTRERWMRIRRLRPGGRWFWTSGTYSAGHNKAKRAKVIYLRDLSRGAFLKPRDARRAIRQARR